MKHHYLLAFGLALSVASTLSLDGAYAYSYRTCNGWPIQIDGNPTIYRDTCSAPTGSAQSNALVWTRTNWFAANPYLSSRIGLSTYNGGCVIDNNNGRNEFALVTRAEISGLNGLTVQHWGLCGFSAATYSEGDIMIANDMVFGNEDESFYGWSNTGQGQVTIAHEFGHFIGLQHSEGFDIMRAYTPEPLVGGSGFHGSPMPDDAAGSRAIVGANGIYTIDFFASAQKFSGGSIQPTDPVGTVNLCRGNTFSLTYTAGNRGNLAASNTGFRIYLTQSLGSPGGGTNMFSGTANVAAGSYFTETRTLTIPNVPNGLYWIQWQIDSGGTSSESDENNNFVHSPMTVNIQC